MNTNKITYREFEPDVRLKDYIKSYWYFSIHTNSEKPFDILPDGYFDLLVVIKGSRIIDATLTGIWCKPVSVCYSENTEIFGVRFKPLSIGGLFKFNTKESLNASQQIVLRDFDLSEQILLDHLNEFPEFLAKYLDKLFLQLIPQNKTDRRLKRCFELIDNSISNITVDEISKTIGLSTRQLHRLVSNM